MWHTLKGDKWNKITAEMHYVGTNFKRCEVKAFAVCLVDMKFKKAY